MITKDRKMIGKILFAGSCVLGTILALSANAEENHSDAIKFVQALYLETGKNTHSIFAEDAQCNLAFNYGIYGSENEQYKCNEASPEDVKSELIEKAFKKDGVLINRKGNYTFKSNTQETVVTVIRRDNYTSDGESRFYTITSEVSIQPHGQSFLITGIDTEYEF